MKEKIFVWWLTRINRLMLVLRYPFLADWWPGWMLKISFVPFRWTRFLEEWGEEHGWYDFWEQRFRRMPLAEREHVDEP